MKEVNHITTEHKLDFEVADWHTEDIKRFRIGTCKGLWGSTWDSYYILSVINDTPNNGHFNDVLEWFEFSCKRDNKNLIVMEIFNPKLYIHLITKRGFVPLGDRGEHVVKVFNRTKLRQLKRNGNEILMPKTLIAV